MRSPPDDFYTVYTPFSAGPPAPIATFPCRSVRVSQIRPVAPAPFFFISGYITIDPPYVHNAGAITLLAPNAFTYDLFSSTPVSLASVPGVLYFIILLDDVVTPTDSYMRLWLVEVGFIP